MKGGGPITAIAPSHLAKDDPRVAWPIFTIQEAAEYLQLPYSTLRGWARPADGRTPLVTAFEAKGHQATVPFVGFAEAFVFAMLRRSGMKERIIREGVEATRARWGFEYALASRRLWTDRSEVLWGAPTEDLMVVRTGQSQFTETVREHLKPVTYAAEDGYATRIQLPQFETTKVIVDPEVAFGHPLVEPAGARVVDILDRFWAGDKMGDIARDLGVPLRSVEEVIRAQTRPPQGIPAA